MANLLFKVTSLCTFAHLSSPAVLIWNCSLEAFLLPLCDGLTCIFKMCSLNLRSRVANECKAKTIYHMVYLPHNDGRPLPKFRTWPLMFSHRCLRMLQLNCPVSFIIGYKLTEPNLTKQEAHSLLHTLPDASLSALENVETAVDPTTL